MKVGRSKYKLFNNSLFILFVFFLSDTFSLLWMNVTHKVEDPHWYIYIYITLERWYKLQKYYLLGCFHIIMLRESKTKMAEWEMGFGLWVWAITLTQVIEGKGQKELSTCRAWALKTKSLPLNKKKKRRAYNERWKWKTLVLHLPLLSKFTSRIIQYNSDITNVACMHVRPLYFWIVRNQLFFITVLKFWCWLLKNLPSKKHKSRLILLSLNELYLLFVIY